METASGRPLRSRIGPGVIELMARSLGASRPKNARSSTQVEEAHRDDEAQRETARARSMSRRRISASAARAGR
jgi:hypothetical protein